MKLRIAVGLKSFTTTTEIAMLEKLGAALISIGIYHSVSYTHVHAHAYKHTYVHTHIHIRVFLC